MLPSYAEVHCLTNYTYLRGASHPHELVRQAWKLGYRALAITDECSVAGVVRAHVEARDLGLKLLIGSEFRLQEGWKLILIAANLNGYGNLCELITLARGRCEKGDYRLTREDLIGAIDDCLIVWCPKEDSNFSMETGAWLARQFDSRCWIAAELLRGPDDAWTLEQLRILSAGTGLKLIAAGDVHMHIRRRRPLQNVLTAIRIGKPVADCGMALYCNGERYLRSIRPSC
jgi:error-prone DNA polymerase